MELGATVFEIGGRTAQDSNDALENIGDGFACPGGGHRYRDAVHLRQSGGTRLQLMVVGVQSQDGQQLAPAQTDADINQPDKAIAEGRLAEGSAHQTRGRLEADEREPRYPVADGLRTRRFG